MKLLPRGSHLDVFFVRSRPATADDLEEALRVFAGIDDVPQAFARVEASPPPKYVDAGLARAVMVNLGASAGGSAHDAGVKVLAPDSVLGHDDRALHVRILPGASAQTCALDPDNHAPLPPLELLP